MTPYFEKLKDPRWQQKRLKIMERDGWKCIVCADEKSTLNVHHLDYSGDPWESPDEMLETLCEDCHEIRERFNSRYGRSILPSPAVIKLLRFNAMLRERKDLDLKTQQSDLRARGQSEGDFKIWIVVKMK